MEITVRLSSGLVRYVGNARVRVNLEQSATVAHLLDRLCTEYPPLAGQLAGAVTVIGGKTVGPAEPLGDGQEVAILIPIAGG